MQQTTESQANSALLANPEAEHMHRGSEGQVESQSWDPLEDGLDFEGTLVHRQATIYLYPQTDPSSAITNQSFENQWTGWTHKNMSLQTNSVFTLKVGNTYVEKWTGRGGSVGDAYLSQVVTGLPPGQYKMRVAAQNIQEDSPTALEFSA